MNHKLVLVIGVVVFNQNLYKLSKKKLIITIIAHLKNSYSDV